MSRGFGTTFGVSATTDSITGMTCGGIGNLVSISCWVYVNGKGGNNFGSVIGNAGYFLYINGNGTLQLEFAATWTSTTGAWDISYGANGRWVHICSNYSFTSTNNIPQAYVNGQAVTVTQNSSFHPAGTPINSASTIGIGGNWDGMLAQLAIWNNTALTAADAVALASGTNPILIQPNCLVSYLPLDGVNNPELDLINGNTTNITGTKLGVSNPAVQSVASAYLTMLDSGLNFSSGFPPGTYLVHHKRRGQPGSVMRGNHQGGNLLV